MIELPWFPPELSPNKRIYWRAKNPIKAAYRDQCARIVGLRHGLHAPAGTKHMPISIVFHPPDKRSRDLDNCLAGFKAGIDGLSMAMGLNDKNFRPITIDFGDVVKNGKIVIKFN